MTPSSLGSWPANASLALVYDIVGSPLVHQNTLDRKVNLTSTMPTGLTSWRSTRRRDRANSENTQAFNSRWGDSTISAPNDGGWYQTASSREATPILSAGEWTSPETAYDDSSHEIEVVRDDYEDGIYLAHGRGYVASTAQDKVARGTITITIPLPWAKKSTRRSTSTAPKPDRPRINAPCPSPGAARLLTRLDTSEYIERDGQRARRPSPIERSRMTVSPILTRGTTEQLPLLTPVVERSKKSPGFNPTQIVLLGSDSDQEPAAARPKHRPTPIKTNSTPAQWSEMTPATLAFGNPLNSHPSRQQVRSQAPSSIAARPKSHLTKSLTTPGLGLGSTMYMRSPSVDTLTRNLNLSVNTSASTMSLSPHTPVHKKYQSTYRRSRFVDPSGISDYTTRQNAHLPTPLVTSFNRRSSTTTSSSDDVSPLSDTAITPIELDPKSVPETYYESRRQWNGHAGKGKTGFYTNVNNDYRLIGKDVDKVATDRRGAKNVKDKSAKERERQRREDRHREKETIEEELRLVEDLGKLHVEREKDWGFVDLVVPVGGQRLVASGEELYG